MYGICDVISFVFLSASSQVQSGLCVDNTGKILGLASAELEQALASTSFATWGGAAPTAGQKLPPRASPDRPHGPRTQDEQLAHDAKTAAKASESLQANRLLCFAFVRIEQDPAVVGSTPHVYVGACERLTTCDLFVGFFPPKLLVVYFFIYIFSCITPRTGTPALSSPSLVTPIPS